MRRTSLLAAALRLAAGLRAQPWMPKVPEPLAAPLAADPMAVTIHRLPNGLTVYLSPYRQEPRITAWIATRAGSRHDASDSTGMAHYLEHMLFKGSADLGTSDFGREKPLLDQVSALYEKLFTAKDPEQRKAIYEKIDGYNVRASTYIIPNELAQAYRQMGFRGLNAFTSTEQTVYICNFPSNRAEAWAKMESNRFSRPVFRSFQTEIETVYEEKNMSMDDPEDSVWEALEKALWKEHPYGRTVLGSVEHLKNPSLAKMYAFYDRNYVPNNMAIALSGDFDRAEMLQLVEKHFGSWKPRGLPKPESFPIVKPKGVERVEVKAEAEEKVFVAWHTVPNGHPDWEALSVLDMVMDNSAAGLINLDLVQGQKVKSAGSFPNNFNEAGIWAMWAVPKKDQKLEEAEALLLETLAKLKAGAFTDADIQAVITNWEVGEKYRLENNDSRVSYMVNSFARYQPWPVTIARMDRLRRVTKADILRTARQYLGDDRVVTYRRQGKPELPKMEKPRFTKLDLKPGRPSKFFEAVLALPAVPPEPRWLVKDRDYSITGLPEGRLYVSANPVNDLFSLSWTFERGSRHERTLCAALDLLELSGAGALSAEDFKKKLYALGSSLSYGCSDQESSVHLSGLEHNLWPSLQLMLQRFQDPAIAPDTLRKMADVAIGAHRDNKKNPDYVFRALSDFAERGQDSDVLRELSDRELLALKEPPLKKLLKDLMSHRRRVSYIGGRAPGELARLIDLGRSGYAKPPARTPVRYLRYPKAQVFFTHRDMVQSQLGMFAADEVYDPEHALDYQFFGSYLGGGMSAVIFQEMREARSLAYHASGGFWTGRKGDEGSLWGYVATQADKTQESAQTLRGLLRDPPLTDQRFAETAKGLEESYRTNPIQFRSVPGAVIGWEDQGLSSDPRPQRFERLLRYTKDDLARFARRFKDRVMPIYILGSRDRVPLETLRALGEPEEKTLEQLFPY